MEGCSIVEKSWGTRERLVETKHIVVDRLKIKAEKACSIHYHKYKTNNFYIISGELIIEIYILDNRGPLLVYNNAIIPGENFEIDIGRIHKFVALEEVECIEISRSDYMVMEDDIMRIPL